MSGDVKRVVKISSTFYRVYKKDGTYADVFYYADKVQASGTALTKEELAYVVDEISKK